MLRLLVSVGFQVLLTSLIGILFIDRSRYFCAIGRQRVLSLGGWSPLLHAGFHVSDATLGHTCNGFPFSPTGLSPSLAGLSSPVHVRVRRRVSVALNPAQARRPERFGLFPFRSPLLRESRLLSLPRATKMFQFARLASVPYGPVLRRGFQKRMTPLPRHRVAPFGNPGISACLTAPPGISQHTTSFIACWRQDIHPTLLVA